MSSPWQRGNESLAAGIQADEDAILGYYHVRGEAETALGFINAAAEHRDAALAAASRSQEEADIASQAASDAATDIEAVISQLLRAQEGAEKAARASRDIAGAVGDLQLDLTQISAQVDTMEAAAAEVKGKLTDAVGHYMEAAGTETPVPEAKADMASADTIHDEMVPEIRRQAEETRGLVGSARTQAESHGAVYGSVWLEAGDLLERARQLQDDIASMRDRVSETADATDELTRPLAQASESLHGLRTAIGVLSNEQNVITTFINMIQATIAAARSRFGGTGGQTS